MQKVKAFLFPFLSGIKINIVGQLPLGEVFALINCLSIKSWITTYKNVPDAKKINFAYLLFFISQVVSDFANGSSINNMLRGWANILFAIVLITFLAKVLWRSPKLIIVYFLGHILQLVLFAPSSEGLSLEDMAFFKFRLAPILNDIILITSYYLLQKNYSKTAVSILIFLYGLFCIAFDFRSNGMFMITTAFILLKCSVIKHFTLKKFIFPLILFGLVFQGLYSIYVYNVLSDTFGGKHANEQLARVNNPYNPLVLLQSGRAETFVAVAAIAEKPILGHGSWAPDPGGKYNYLVSVMHGDEEKFNDFAKNNELIIPSHSVLLGGWMTSGILGFFGLLLILSIFIKRTIWTLKNFEKINLSFLPILIFFLLSGIWTFLFSPLPHIRQTLPIIIVFPIVIYSNYSSNLQN